MSLIKPNLHGRELKCKDIKVIFLEKYFNRNFRIAFLVMPSV